MTDIMGFSPPLLAAIITVLATVMIICRTALAGWRDWVHLKHAEMATATAQTGQGMDGRADDRALSAVSRIELADMRERLRQLEAIAAGVDL